MAMDAAARGALDAFPTAIAEPRRLAGRFGAAARARRRLRRVGASARSGRGLLLMLAGIALLAVPAYVWLKHGWKPEGEAKWVFDRVHPGMVVVFRPGGSGSGVLLSEDGLMLTNRHVIEGADAIAVTAQGWGPRGWCQDLYVDVRVLGVHPRYDAALLKISAPGMRFVPAGVRALRNTVQTGERCYVIGSPGVGNGRTLQNTITAGLVSAAERRIDGLAYIQTSAAINPGNSGGALCDTSGRLIGLVTFKASWLEGVGFAIPWSGIRLAEFQPQ